MSPLLYRGIAILIGAGLVSALIVSSRQTIPLEYHTAAFFFMVGMLGTAAIVLLRLYLKGGAKLKFSFVPDENSPWTWLAGIASFFLWAPPLRYDSAGAVLAFFIGSFVVTAICRLVVGEVEK